MSELVVHHFGPDPSTVGGMASVIRILTEHSVGGDIVVSHPTWTPGSSVRTAEMVASAAYAIARMPPGQVAHLHLSEGGSFVREGALVALARARGLVTVVTMHGASFLPFAHRYPRLAAAVLRRANVITCLDHETLNFVRANAPRALSEVVANPIFVEESFVRADETEELVLFAGEIGLRKGADVMQRAWLAVARRRPSARCVMVGPAGDFSPPEVERLEVRSPVGPDEMKAMLRLARVVALPSRAEGMPMVLTEAMSLGRPFVSTPVGGIPELQEGGFLVPVDDHSGLASALTRLLEDRELARSVGERGRSFCLQTRGVETIGASLRRLYAEASMGPSPR